MAKIKLTTLTDKMSDDEILAKLKNIGVKFNEKDKEEVIQEKKDEKAAVSGETVIEKRIASSIIRRRVQPPPPLPKEPEPPKETIKPTGKEAAPIKLIKEKGEKAPVVSEKTISPHGRG